MIKLVFLALLCLPLAAQTPQPPQLSPKAAYDEAMHPTELTRNSITNWSDTELSVYKVTIFNAGTACAARRRAPPGLLPPGPDRRTGPGRRSDRPDPGRVRLQVGHPEALVAEPREIDAHLVAAN